MTELILGSHLAVLTAGYLAGRRSYRRQLQTTDGRERAGLQRSEPLIVVHHPGTEPAPILTRTETLPSNVIPLRCAAVTR